MITGGILRPQPIDNQLQLNPLRLSGWRGCALKDAWLDVREGHLCVAPERQLELHMGRVRVP